MVLNACTLFKLVRYEGAGMGRVGEGGVVGVWRGVFGGIFAN